MDAAGRREHAVMKQTKLILTLVVLCFLAAMMIVWLASGMADAGLWALWFACLTAILTTYGVVNAVINGQASRNPQGGSGAVGPP